MHELDLTKESWLPPLPLLFSFPRPPSIPLLLGAQPHSCYPPALGSRVWKNKRSDWINDKIDLRREVSACALLFLRSVQSLWTERQDSVCDSDPENCLNLGVDVGAASKPWEVHTAMHYVWRSSIYKFTFTAFWPVFTGRVWGQSHGYGEVLTHWKCLVILSWVRSSASCCPKVSPHDYASTHTTK